jgi:UDP-2-acetamido-3-amino-2,3-dideoxy-glucuronate N-acetyltransferase
MRNVAIVGKGYWGKNIARNLNEMGRLGMVVDFSPEIIAASKTEYPDALCTSNFDELLENKNIVAVFIATPAHTHAEVAIACMNAGKDVFIEKPMCLELEDGYQLKETAERLGRVLMVGHILLYHPCVVKLKELISNGELGKIQYIYSNRLNFGKIRTEESSFWSFAPHDISVVNFLMDGHPTGVIASGKDDVTHQVHDTTLSIMDYPGGAKAHIFVSWLHPYKEQRLIVVGDKAMAVFSDTAEHKLVTYSHKIEWVNQAPVANAAEAIPVEFEQWEPLRRECEHFLECVESRERPLTDIENGLGVMEVLIASDRSIANNGARVVIGDSGPAWKAHASAQVEEGATIGAGTSIWHNSHVMANAVIGDNCSLGMNVHVANGVEIGNQVKIQNNVSLYTGAILEDDVFLGPSCVLTNVTNPRSQVSRRNLYETTRFRRGATIGANATIVCGTTIGRYAFVAAGAVVAEDVPDYALVVGVPGKVQGWMSRHGHRLNSPDVEGTMTCPESGLRYQEKDGLLSCLDLDEEAPLPDDLRVGQKKYDEFKTQES